MDFASLKTGSKWTAVDYDDRRPLYAQIGEKLEAMVRSDAFPDDRIPTERELAKAFNVSVITIKQAINALVSKDLVYRRPRRGTFVKRVDHSTTERSNELLTWLSLDVARTSESDVFRRAIGNQWELSGPNRRVEARLSSDRDPFETPIEELLDEADLYTMNSAWARRLGEEERLGETPPLPAARITPAAVGAVDDFRGTGAVPLAVNVTCLYCNRSVFAENGVDFPVAGMGWDDLAKRLTSLPERRKGETLCPFAYFTYAARFWELFVWQDGGVVFDEDGRCRMDEPANVVGLKKTFDFLRSIGIERTKDLSLNPIEFFHEKHGDDLACFVGSPRFHSLLNSGSDDWITVPIPTVGRKITGANAVFLGVNAKGRSVDEARCLSNLFLSESAQSLLAKERFNVPIDDAVARSVFQKTNGGRVDLTAFLNDDGYEARVEEPWSLDGYLFYLMQDMFRQCRRSPDSLNSVCAEFARIANNKRDQSIYEPEVSHAL